MALLLLLFFVVIIIRVLSISGPVLLFEKNKKNKFKMLTVMSWGGMRGGISIALALSIPDIPQKNTIIGITYIAVVMSIIIQGPLVDKLFPSKKLQDAEIKTNAQAGS